MSSRDYLRMSASSDGVRPGGDAAVLHRRQAGGTPIRQERQSRLWLPKGQSRALAGGRGRLHAIFTASGSAFKARD